MKKQTFIFEINNKEGKQIDFFRHSLKTLKGVQRKERKFWQEEREKAIYNKQKGYSCGSYEQYIKDDNIVVIYKTSCNSSNDNIIYMDTMANFLKLTI